MSVLGTQRKNILSFRQFPLPEGISLNGVYGGGGVCVCASVMPLAGVSGKDEEIITEETALELGTEG